MAKFELFRNKADHDYYFLLKVGGWHTILASKAYVSKQGCRNAIEWVRSNAPFDNRYERKDGRKAYSFNLKAENGEVIGYSERFTTRYTREDEIEFVKRIAPKSTIEDLT